MYLIITCTYRALIISLYLLVYTHLLAQHLQGTLRYHRYDLMYLLNEDLQANEVITKGITPV